MVVCGYVVTTFVGHLCRLCPTRHTTWERTPSQKSFVFFGLALNLSSYLIGFAGALIITREIWVSALRDYNSRNNNSNATKVIYIAKIKTTIQIFTISIYLFALAFNFMLLIPIADILMIIAVLITLYTGYLYTVNTFKN